MIATGDEWWQRMGKGMFPVAPAAVDVKEVIARRAADGEGWAVAWALLRVAEAIDGEARTRDGSGS